MKQLSPTTLREALARLRGPESQRHHPFPLGPQRRRLVRMSGYRPRSPRLYRLWNLILVVPLILFTLPLVALVALALALTQGPRNVFYFGPRIGKDQRPFHIIKFKTLRDDAARLTRDRVLPANSRLETTLGKPLRETRLDELPQLFNVLKGDMNMLGPRPVRQAIADQARATIPNYDLRFSVKPGLIGYTQALMPHGADKAIRARVNAMLCRRPVMLAQEVAFVALTGLSVLAWMAKVSLRIVGELFGRPAWSAPHHGEVRIEAPDLADRTLRLTDITAESLRMVAARPLPEGNGPYVLVLRRGYLLGDRAKTARCTAVILASEPDEGGTCYTLRYSATTPLQRYLIERHFVRSVLVA
jgi:lipopolysaccharide/colanic/teichoic acid biosynthesis glycosyltransferase